MFLIKEAHFVQIFQFYVEIFNDLFALWIPREFVVYQQSKAFDGWRYGNRFIAEFKVW